MERASCWLLSCTRSVHGIAPALELVALESNEELSRAQVESWSARRRYESLEALLAAPKILRTPTVRLCSLFPERALRIRNRAPRLRPVQIRTAAP